MSLKNISDEYRKNLSEFNNRDTRKIEKMEDNFLTSLSSNSSGASNPTPLQQPPPLPPRTQQSVPPMNYSYNNYYNNYPFNNYMNPYNGVYNFYNENQNKMSSFSQVAESKTRQAFESVEGLVRTFSSVAMMLDSTYQAIFNSFRAVLGVSDQMTQLKSHLTNVFSTIAFLKLFKIFLKKFKKILRWLRGLPLETVEDAAEKLWQENSHTSHELDRVHPRSPTWPIIVFFAAIISGPWLLWKLLSTISSQPTTKNWAKRQTEHYVAYAEFSFQASNPDELSFPKGSKIIIAPEELQNHPKGWLMASIDGENVGLVPRNYLKIFGKQKPFQKINS